VTWRLVTGLFILAIPFAIGVYDVIAYEIAGNDATISKQCLCVSERTLAFVVCVSVLVGIMLGHLFLPQHVTD
jgi:uncharacterized membrane protein